MILGVDICFYCHIIKSYVELSFEYTPYYLTRDIFLLKIFRTLPIGEAMSLNEKIVEDLKNAIKSKDELRISCLRMLKTSVKNKQVEKRRELNDGEIHTVISSLIRKSKEAQEEFKRGDREDLALKEEKEIDIFYEYLPQQLTSEQIEKTVREIISELSAKDSKDLGNVMKTAMARMAGQAEGKAVNEIARKVLS